MSGYRIEVRRSRHQAGKLARQFVEYGSDTGSQLRLGDWLLKQLYTFIKEALMDDCISWIVAKGPARFRALGPLSPWPMPEQITGRLDL